jgi:putative SOS response-associated peptidase YedK
MYIRLKGGGLFGFAGLYAHQNDVARLTAMLSPLEADRMEAYPVAPLVNAFQNDGPELILALRPPRGAIVQAPLPL